MNQTINPTRGSLWNASKVAGGADSAFLDPNLCPANNKNAIETHF